MSKSNIYEASLEPAIGDQSCWSTLYHGDASHHFKRFGAVEIVETEDPFSTANKTFMLKTEDGRWWYAHADDSSCYVSCSQSFVGATAEQALAHRVLKGCKVRVEEARKTLQRAVECWDDAQRRAVALHGCEFDTNGNPVKV